LVTAISPELTGRAGFTYEAQVAAYFLIALLFEGEIRGLEGSVAERVSAQQGHLGAPLDDLIIEGRRGDGSLSTLHLQAK
jgi:hypothetical protein